MMKSGRWDVQEHAGVDARERALRRRGPQGPGVRLPAVHGGRGPRELRGVHERACARTSCGRSARCPRSCPASCRGRSRCRSAATATTGHQRPPHRPASCSRFLQRNFQAVFMTEPSVYSTPASRTRGAAPLRDPRRHAHGRPLPLAARPHARAAGAARAADEDAGAGQPGRLRSSARLIASSSSRKRHARLGRGLERTRRDGARLALVEARLALQQGDDRVVVPSPGDEAAGGAQGLLPAMNHEQPFVAWGTHRRDGRAA